MKNKTEIKQIWDIMLRLTVAEKRKKQEVAAHSSVKSGVIQGCKSIQGMVIIAWLFYMKQGIALKWGTCGRLFTAEWE